MNVRGSKKGLRLSEYASRSRTSVEQNISKTGGTFQEWMREQEKMVGREAEGVVRSEKEKKRFFINLTTVARPLGPG